MSTSLNLHIRLTTACNASCSYCSCEIDKPSDIMPVDEFEKSLKWLINKYKSVSTGLTNCNIEILGGELLILPTDYINSIYKIIKTNVSSNFDSYTLGSQTNLIGSDRKIKNLFEISNGAIGTSTDNFSGSRTVNNSAEKYSELSTKGAIAVENLSGSYPGAVIVFDETNISHVQDEYNLASSLNRRITIRQVFKGANDINTANIKTMASEWEKLINIWFLKGTITINPFDRILRMMLGMSQGIGCPFWNTCAGNSINMEPNGDLFLCQEMADSKAYKLGNSIEESWDQSNFIKLSKRRLYLSDDCNSCEYLEYCQGGCMLEAHLESDDIYAKPKHCLVWKSMFGTLKELTTTNDRDEIIHWLDSIES